MTPDLVIFDLDGVLIDSEWLLSKVWSSMLEEFGVSLSARVLADRFAGKTDQNMANLIAEETGAVAAEDMLKALRHRAEAALETDLEAIEGAEALLKNLPFQKCICSNSGPTRLRQSLKTTGLDKYFDDARLFSGGEVANPKPAPDLHHHALATLCIAPERAIVIEDSVTGVIAARAAGIPVLGFLGASHIGDGHKAALMAEGAAMTVPHHRDLLDAIATL